MQVLVRPRYTTGQHFRLEVEQSKSKRHSISHIDLSVTRSDSDGYLLLWRPQWIEVLGDPSSLDMEIDPDLLDQLRDLHFELAFDENGLWMGISNEFEVKQILSRFCQAILAASKSEALHKILTPELFFASARKVVSIYYGFSGRLLQLGTRTTAETLAPNPFGGDPIPTSVTVATEAAGENEYTIRAEQRCEAAPLLRCLAEAGSFEFPPGLTNANIIDLTEYTLSATTLQMDTVRFTRNYDHPAFDELEFIEIRLH